ncbi:MAG: alpha/beta hydrolase [Bacillota bacterium]
MKIRSILLKGTKDSVLHVDVYQPKEDCRGVLHILHGMGEHAKRYKSFSEYMTTKGFVIVVHDHRGHGKSLKPKQAVGILDKTDTHQAMVDDINVVQDYIMTTYPSTPIIILGHSMGSMLLRNYLHTYQPKIAEAIIMGTLPIYSRLYIKVMRLLVAFMRPFSSMTNRHKLLSNMLNSGLINKIDNPKSSFDWLTYDEVNVSTYINDPLSGYAYNYRFYQSFFKLIDYTSKKQIIDNTPNIPLLIISGENDPINDKNKAIDTVSSAYKSFDITVKKVPNARHEVLNDQNKASTYEYIYTWITSKGEKQHG